MKYYTMRCSIESKELTEVNYGIMILYDDGSSEYICDISDCVEDVELLVNRLNTYHIESNQAKEVIEDFKFNKK